jgi:preprotein translocase subunit SecE
MADTPENAKRADAGKPKVSAGEFVRQVRQEMRRVTWPTRKETVQMTVMVAILSTIMAIFFLLVDQYFASIVRTLVHEDQIGIGGSVLLGSFVLVALVAGYFTLFRSSSR